MSTPTWTALRERYSDDALFDIVSLIGLYSLTCMTRHRSVRALQSTLLTL